MNLKYLAHVTLALILIVGCSENKNSSFDTDRIGEETIAFKNVNLVPMTTQKVIKNQTVLIRGTKIIAIGPSNEVNIPENTTVIEGYKAYLMPGLADMHMHTREDWLSDAWPVSPMNLYLANGVTTIRCFGPSGRSPDHILRWRDEINKGNLIGPRIYTCGRILYGPVENPQKEIREQKNRGFDFIKIYSFVSKDEFHQAITTAKQLGIYTAGHIPFSVGLDGVLSEGMDEIAHIEELDFEFLDFDRTKKMERIELFRYILDTATWQHKGLIGLDIKNFDQRYGKIISAIIGKLQSANIPICTTLVVGEGIVAKLHETETFLARPENKYFPKGYLDAFQKGKEKHQVIFRGYEDFASFKYKLERLLLKRLKQAGIPLLLSTDAGTGGMGIVPGFSIHDELRILTENGFTPYEAIATGTVTAAKVVQTMTGEGNFGTIEVGKQADLILVNKNPLEDVANIKDLRGVMAAGRWYDRAALNNMITPRISVTGAIHHVQEPDKRLNTYIDIIIGNNFPGKLPDAIESITVTGPTGDLPIRKDDFTYIPSLRDFWIRIPGSPAIGKYTFTISSGDMSGSDVDKQSVVRTILVPSTNTFRPVKREKLTCRTLTFSWDAVGAKVPLYYRLDVKDMKGNRIYRTQYIKDMRSIRLPHNLFKVGQTYRWRIRVADESDWIKINNRSHSPWLPFTIGETVGKCNYMYRIPNKTDDGWDTASLAEAGINPSTIIDLVGKILNGDFPNVHSVILVKNGKLVLEEYFPGYTFNFSGEKFKGEKVAFGREKAHNLASVTKSITSALLGIAIGQGFVRDVNEPMTAFFPQYANSIDIKKSRITLEHLLTMTSGLDWNELERWFRDPEMDLTALFKVPDPIKYILSKDVIHEPGTRWYYSGGDVNLLGEVIRKASGLRMDAFAKRYLMVPLGIEVYEWDHINPDVIHASGNLKLLPRDMAKFGQLFLNGGTWNDKRIISEHWIEKSTRPIISVPMELKMILAKEYLDWAETIGKHYGYLWWIKSFCTKSGCENSYLADGWGGQRIVVFPNLDVVAVLTGGNYVTQDPCHEIISQYILPAVQ
jgi:CubicO group peptidase (beta-lactamase class C family)